MCVLTDRYVQESQINTLEKAIEEGEVELPLVIVNDPVESEIDPGLAASATNERFGLDTVRLFVDALKYEGAWALVYAEKKIAELLGERAASSSRIPVEEVPCLSDSEIHYTTPIVDGAWSELPQDAVKLTRENCDVAIRFGFGLLRGDILEAPEFGVLSFHLADIRQYRGLGVQQAWLDDRERMGVTLQRINEEIDGGEIVAYDETDVSDCATLWEVYDVLHELQAELLVEGLDNLRNRPTEITPPDSLGPYYSLNSRRGITFAGRTLLKNVSGRIRR